ncbi:MAG: hypothetical protein IT392_07145 [Nitrospirae bacterium]|nr:hypothetical protein [Nitrospirota bacterium]
MFTREELTRLNTVKGNGELFTTVYLNVNPVTNTKGEYFVTYRNLVKSEVDKLSNTDQKVVKEDVKKIETYLKSAKTEFKKSLVIISSTQLDMWEIYHLSVPLKNQVVIDKTPYLKPLTSIMEQNRSYAVALVDRVHARLFNIQLGEIAEYAELLTPDIPGKHKKGGWQGRNENRFRRHIDQHIHFHLRDVVTKLEGLLVKGEVSHIIIGGSEESLLLFTKMLSQPITAKTAGTFTADMHAGNDEILEKSMQIIRGVEKTGEEGLVEELVTRASKNGSAAAGLEDVLSQMQKGNIHHLVYLAGFSSSGYKCQSCDFLTIQDLKTCPFCNTALENVEHLIDFTIQKAIDMGSQISAIAENRQLQEVGNIGALLRY